MKTTTQLLGAVSAMALVVMTSTPAMAEGIRAGTEITNTVTITYDVDGVTQTPETATDVFDVDRRVNIDVTTLETANVEVSPGETNAVLSYTVTNLSNDIVDLDLTAVLVNNSGLVGTNTGAADPVNDANDDTLVMFVDANNDNIAQAGEIVTHLSNVATDASVVVKVTTNVNLAATDGTTIDIDLNANAFLAGSIGAPGTGTELEESTADSADQSVVDTVLADGNSTLSLDADNDGSDTDRATFEVGGAEVTVTKSSSVIWDPVNLFDDPKAIPGAIIEYCIAVENAADSSTATNITVSDSLPADVTYLPASDARSNGILVDTDVTVTGGNAVCSNGSAPAGGADDGFTAASGGNPATVVGDLSDIPEDDGAGLSFRVEIPAATAATPAP
ncbi:MAG: hypothetical protein AAF127_00225 [Pseudomonadota bacterium]